MASDEEFEYGDQGGRSSDDEGPVEHPDQLSSQARAGRPESRLAGPVSVSGQAQSSSIGPFAYGPPPEGGYNPDEYEGLPVSNEVQDLFQYITQYKPEVLQLETPLKPFIPDYVPAIGEIDEFIKVARPDGKPDLLGLKVLDEPAALQSDPSVLTMQLRQASKQAGHGAAATAAVSKVQDPAKNSKRITDWIKSISDLQKGKPGSAVHISNAMPDIESLMQQWPPEVEQQLQSIRLPDASLDVDLLSFAKMVCSILDIPVYDNPIESMHVLFTLLLEFRNNPAFKASTGMNLADNKSVSQPNSQSQSRSGPRSDSQSTVSGRQSTDVLTLS